MHARMRMQAGGVGRMQAGGVGCVQAGGVGRVQAGGVGRVQAGGVGCVQAGGVGCVQAGGVGRMQIWLGCSFRFEKSFKCALTFDSAFVSPGETLHVWLDLERGH